MCNNAAIYYTTTGDALTVTLSEQVLRRAIDRDLAISVLRGREILADWCQRFPGAGLADPSRAELEHQAQTLADVAAHRLDPYAAADRLLEAAAGRGPRDDGRHG